MAKKGMKRPETDFMKPPKNNNIEPVPEIRDKAKKGKDNNKIMPYNNQSK
jgi:hypothetical protein